MTIHLSGRAAAAAEIAPDLARIMAEQGLCLNLCGALS